MMMAVRDTALRASIELPPEPRSVPAARSVLAQLLSAWSAEWFCDKALLLLSELVTNVVRHVGGALVLVQVELAGPVLRVSVTDDSPESPRRVEPGAGGGHGLWLLAALADRWGSERDGGGKRVWFELRRAAGQESVGA